MKILEQIVDYLAQRGALAPEEVQQLEALGFIRTEAERDPWYHERYDEGEVNPEPYDPIEPRPRAHPRPRHRKLPPLRAPTLAARLRAVLRAAEPHLAALASVAPVTGHEGRASTQQDRWERLPAIARAAPEKLADSIPLALASGATSFRALWDAIDADDYLTAVHAGEHGPVAAAYRALIALGDHREMGRHLWILRRRVVARCYELMRAQDRAAEGLHAAYQRSPALVGQWIAQEPHPVAYWCFVLLYNAERAERKTPWEPFAGEQPARRRSPSPLDYSRASARALQLGGEPVARFLKACWTAEITARRLWATLSPPGSPEAYSEDWLRAELSSNPSLAAGHGPRLLEAMSALRRLDFEPTQRLIEDRLAAPAAEEPPSLDGPLAWTLHVTLFCPSGWN